MNTKYFFIISKNLVDPNCFLSYGIRRLMRKRTPEKTRVVLSFPVAEGDILKERTLDIIQDVFRWYFSFIISFNVYCPMGI